MNQGQGQVTPAGLYFITTKFTYLHSSPKETQLSMVHSFWDWVYLYMDRVTLSNINRSVNQCYIVTRSLIMGGPSWHSPLSSYTTNPLKCRETVECPSNDIEWPSSVHQCTFNVTFLTLDVTRCSLDRHSTFRTGWDLDISMSLYGLEKQQIRWIGIKEITSCRVFRHPFRRKHDKLAAISVTTTSCHHSSVW